MKPNALRVAITTSILLTLMGLFSEADEPDDLIRIDGTVTDDRGRELRGITIRVSTEQGTLTVDEELSQLTTDRNGKYWVVMRGNDFTFSLYYDSPTGMTLDVRSLASRNQQIHKRFGRGTIYAVDATLNAWRPVLYAQLAKDPDTAWHDLVNKSSGFRREDGYSAMIHTAKLTDNIATSPAIKQGARDVLLERLETIMRQIAVLEESGARGGRINADKPPREKEDRKE